MLEKQRLLKAEKLCISHLSNGMKKGCVGNGFPEYCKSRKPETQ